MDDTKREITKIAREASKLTVRMMKETGIGSGEFDLIHLVRHHPGISQKEICKALNMDKGAVAKRVANLEQKGYLFRKENPEDGRSRLLYATDKADLLKNSKQTVETAFYEWLLEEMPEAERAAFCASLETLYLRSKMESRSGFPHIYQRLGEPEHIYTDVRKELIQTEKKVLMQAADFQNEDAGGERDA